MTKFSSKHAATHAQFDTLIWQTFPIFKFDQYYKMHVINKYINESHVTEVHGHTLQIWVYQPGAHNKTLKMWHTKSDMNKQGTKLCNTCIIACKLDLKNLKLHKINLMITVIHVHK
jgi:hypothetical protein